MRVRLMVAEGGSALTNAEIDAMVMPPVALWTGPVLQFIDGSEPIPDGKPYRIGRRCDCRACQVPTPGVR